MSKNKKNQFILKYYATGVVAVLLFALCIILQIMSGRFAEEPVVEAVPDNCYSETLVVITDEDYSPYSFYDANGDYSGHDVELITLVANNLNMNLDLKFMNWYDGIAAINAGEADVLMTCDYSDSFQGVDSLIKSEPISSDEFIVYSKTKVKSIDELYGKRIAIMKEGNATAQIDMLNLHKFCTEYINNREAMQALIDGEVDVAIMRQNVGSVLMNELNCKDVDGYISIGQSYMCFGINADNPQLAVKIDNALEEMKMSGELARLSDKWLTTFIRPYTMKEVIMDNLWVVLIFGVLILVFIIRLFRNAEKRIIDEEEKYRSAQVVELLAKDFSCVNYIVLTDSKREDPVINYRVSEELKELIPGWENEKHFYKKMEMLRDTLVYEPDREQFMEDVDRYKVLGVLEEADVYYANIRMYINDEIQYYQMKFSAVSENGKLVGVVAGLHSIDEQTKREMTLMDQLTTALENAEIANKSKTEFLFSMSHDIRTPMNAIIGFTNMAMKYIDDKEKSMDCLRKAGQSGSLLLSLINGILDVSRIESGKVVLDENYGDVNLSFIAIEETMKEQAIASDVDLSFEIGNIKNRYVVCDLDRCNRIFVNIISNAIKYSKDKDAYVKVRCEQVTDAKDGYAKYCYTFADNGIGMSEEFQKHIFEKFSREKSVTISGIQGTGLGMAVCKSFIDLMGGSIDIKSKLGVGTTVKVYFNFKVQEEENYTDPYTREVISSSMGMQNNVAKQLEGKRILLAEDNELNREIAIDILEEKKIIVEAVEDGVFAVSTLKEKGPDYYDFILMDIQMPIMNGYEATKQIREMYPDKHTPIIALSANAFAEDKDASIKAGMDNHVAKPINLDELFQVLSQYLITESD